MNRDELSKELKILDDKLVEIQERQLELRKALEEADPPSPLRWKGMWGYTSDDNPDCPADGVLYQLEDYDGEEVYPFKITYEDERWRYFRPAPMSELNLKNPVLSIQWDKIDSRFKSCGFHDDGELVLMENRNAVVAKSGRGYNGCGDVAFIDRTALTTVIEFPIQVFKRP